MLDASTRLIRDHSQAVAVHSRGWEDEVDWQIGKISHHYRKMKLMWLAVLVTLVTVTTITSVDVRIGYSARPSKFLPAVISLGLKRARNEGMLLDHNISLAYRISSCDPVDIVAAEIELVNDENVDVIMGRTCGKGCIAVGYYHTFYKMPRVPTSCSEPTLTDKASFPTFVRCMSSADKVGRAIEQVFLKYGWKRTGLLYRESGTCEYGIRDSKKRLENNNVTVTDLMPLPSDAGDVTDEMLRRSLIAMKERTRVVLLCHRWSVVRRVLLIAYELGMQNPDYVFIAYQYLPTSETIQPWLQPGVNVSDTQAARDKAAFTALKQISMASFDPEKYESFHETVKIESDKKPWNITVEELSNNNYLMFLVDCSYLYFTALHELLADGADYRDGRLVFQKAKNRTFHGLTGRVVINDNADRDPDYWVWDCPPDMAKCRPYSYISISPPSGMDDFLDPYWGTDDGRSPPDTPKCGFRGELCLEKTTTTTIIGIIAAAVIVTAVAIGLGYYRRQDYREKQLHMMTWKINFKDIDFSGKLGDTSMRSMRSMSSMDKSRGSQSALTTNEQLFTKVGVLNGTVVAVKHVNKAAVTVNRELLVELKTMKDLVHENFNQFIGACVEAPNICIITGYCSKGSLQDVIENDDISLDWMFKSSLMRDLINGMCFLGTTKIQHHGSLRSSCCMIDGRWVLKIAGFGLRIFKAGMTKNDASEFKKYQKLLWTAPELLRMNERERPPYGTEQGDVYSFAIIMQEIIYRAAPYFGILSPADIVEHVRCVGEVPYRPQCTEVVENIGVRSEVITLMERCWSEDPHSRPTFEDIRKIFKILNKGTNTNIMDNMIRMMEKYASNLEGLVQQRTGELLDEKKKTDMLLYRMLPPSIAEQLKSGLAIIPEMYDSVTIYFSDIVGFTSLSSSSTPMEVVDLLNDLYTTFDATIEVYDVYKVETIGDAYMVVSGVPRRNGSNHASEIADMALSLLTQVLTFKIRHRPDLTLNLRIGLHTGPCAAGVVGQTMPRFCLFGDTVNMASRMESTGEAQKIHISEATMRLLADTGRYTIQLRGNTEVKGKGLVTTYWLQPKAGMVQ